MITLYTFGPRFGLPDPSPFVLKTMAHLAMSGLPHRTEVRPSPVGAPKGKLPYIDDDGTIVADSVFILDHLKRAHGVDLDAHLTRAQRAQAWAIERMLEDHLYWAIVHARWAVDANFEKGPSQFFAGAPEAAKAGARERVKTTLQGQGFGRHAEAEIAELASRDFAAASALLGESPYLFGAEPSAADATLFSFVAAASSPLFETPVRTAAGAHENLVRHRDRILARYFPPTTR